jgi:hypothetical protein
VLACERIAVFWRTAACHGRRDLSQTESEAQRRVRAREEDRWANPYRTDGTHYPVRTEPLPTALTDLNGQL